MMCGTFCIEPESFIMLFLKWHIYIIIKYVGSYTQIAIYTCKNNYVRKSSQPVTTKNN